MSVLCGLGKKVNILNGYQSQAITSGITNVTSLFY